MIDLSVGIELTLDEAITSPSGFSRSSAPRCSPSSSRHGPAAASMTRIGAVPRQSARLARVLLTATACRRLHPREGFRRDLSGVSFLSLRAPFFLLLIADTHTYSALPRRVWRTAPQAPKTGINNLHTHTHTHTHTTTHTCLVRHSCSYARK